MKGYAEKPKQNSLLSWLAGVLVMAEEVVETSAVTGRRRPGEGDTHTHTDGELNHKFHSKSSLTCHCDTSRPRSGSRRREEVLLTRLKES